MAGYSRHEVEASFRAALSVRQLEPPNNLIADGKIHRCKVVGDTGNKSNGAYLLHLDGFPAGGYQNHKDGGGWQSWHYNGNRTMTARERYDLDEHIKRSQQERIKCDQERHEKARLKAVQLWEASKPVTHSGHAYLYQKRLKSAFGARLYKSSLVVPVYDRAGVIHSLQFIRPDGSKRFLTGGKKAGLFFPIEGAIDRFYICEGFATGATVRMLTGCMTIVAFDAGNLLPVTRTIRSCFPETPIIIAADDDHMTEGNPGLTKAQDAAACVDNVKVVLPDFSGLPRTTKDTDFNDQYCLQQQMKEASHDHAA